MEINIKDIIKNIPEDLENNEEILRYIYIKLGNIFSYNRDYLYATDSRFSKDIYEDYLNIEIIDNAKIENKIEAVCKQITDILVEVINKIPEEKRKDTLSAKMLGYRKQEENHVAALVKSGDKNYYMDLYKDMYAIQKGFRTKYFALSGNDLEKELEKNLDMKADLRGIKCDEIPEENLEKTDKKLGYSFNGIYMDEAVEMLRKEMQIEDNWKKYEKDYEEITKKENKEDVITRLKLDFIFNNFRNNAKEDKIGMIELTKFYKRLYQTLLTKEEQNKNQLRRYDVTLRDNKNIPEDSMIYEVKREKENIYYIYKSENGKFVKITPKEILKIEEEGKLQYISQYSRPEFYKDFDELSR